MLRERVLRDMTGVARERALRGLDKAQESVERWCEQMEEPMRRMREADTALAKVRDAHERMEAARHARARPWTQSTGPQDGSW